MHKCAKAHCQLLGCKCRKERYLSTEGGGVGRGHSLIPDTLLRISLKQSIERLCKYITGFPAHFKSCNQTIQTKKYYLCLLEHSHWPKNVGNKYLSAFSIVPLVYAYSTVQF